MYSVYINGELAAFSACADYPFYKFYDEIEILKFCKIEIDVGRGGNYFMGNGEKRGGL